MSAGINKLVVKVAARFVLDRRSFSSDQGFVSLIASISIAGLALGVTALLVVTAVINGFERELKRALTSFHGHVLLFSRGEPVSDPRKFVEDLPRQFPSITAVSPYVFAEVMLSSKFAVSGAVVEGVDRESVSKVSSVESHIIAGRMPNTVESGKNPEIVLGSEIARRLKLQVGDFVVLTVPFAKDNNQPLVQRLSVSGIVKIGMFDHDNKYAVMDLRDCQKILGLGEKVNAFKIATKDASTSASVTEVINEKYVYPMRARDWSSLNRNLFFAIAHQKIVISTILLAIVLVASFNVVSTILMMVHDKKRQIAMLKAMGWGRSQTFSVFMLIGAAMSVLGVLLGLGLGRALAALVAWKSIIDLPADVYVLSRLPVEIRPWEWAIICIATVALAVFSALLPSYRVSRESPVEGLSYE